MISYKRDVLERQSLSEVKMGRGSPICERVHKKIVEYFKKQRSSIVKSQGFAKSPHLQQGFSNLSWRIPSPVHSVSPL